MPFTNAVRNKIVQGTPAQFKSFVIFLFLVPDLMVRNPTGQFDELNVMGLIGSQDGRGQVAALNCQRQVNYSYHNEQHRQSNVHGDLTRNSYRLGD